MSILSFISGIFEPAARLIDNIHTSDEERLTLKAELLRIQTGVITQSIELEKTALNAKASIIMQESKADSWLTRSWRPITMLSLVAAVLAHFLGLTPDTLSEEVVLSMFGLVKIGIGGYITSRGAEKVIPKIVEAMKKREDA